MRRIDIEAGAEDIQALQAELSRAGIQMMRKRTLHVNAADVGHYISVGAGVLGLANCLAILVKSRHQTRKFKLVQEDGTQVTIEANSVAEIETLLQSTRQLLISER